MPTLNLVSEDSQLRDVIQQRIDKKHQANKKIKDREKEKGISLLDRLALKQNQAEIKKLGDLLSEFNKFRFMAVTPSKVSDSIKERLESIMSQLPRDNADAIRKIFSHEVRSSTSAQRHDIETQASLVHGLLTKNGITKGVIFSRGEKFTYSQVVENKKKELMDKLNIDPTFLSIKSPQSSVASTPEDLLIENLQSLNPEQIKGDKNIQAILTLAANIKDAFKRKRVAEHINLEISLVISELGASSIDFLELTRMLQGIAKENQKTIQRCNDYLAKFDLEKAKEVAKKIMEEKQKQDNKESFLKSYRALAYDLAKAQDEGKSFDEIAKIKEKMRTASVNATLAGAMPSEINDALLNGKNDYYLEKRHRETLAQVRHEEMEEERALDAEMNRVLRQMAIQELEHAGAFEETHEWRDGDVRSTLDEDKKEAMIHKKMQEIVAREKSDEEKESARQEVQRGNNIISSVIDDLRRYAVQDLELNPDFKRMTEKEQETAIRKKMSELANYSKLSPEQRGLADFKSKGIVEQDTILKDLRPQQLADFRVAYHDTEQDREIKEIQRQIASQTQRNTNTIYKQYIRYLATVEDKSAVIKFSEYARVLYGQEEVDLSMIEEEKGKSI